jgi:hypothetical protein
MAVYSKWCKTRTHSSATKVHGIELELYAVLFMLLSGAMKPAFGKMIISKKFWPLPNVILVQLLQQAATEK